MSDILPNDYDNMTLEVITHNSKGDLVARAVETGRHIDVAHATTNPAFLRLRARALEALANAIEEAQ